METSFGSQAKFDRKSIIVGLITGVVIGAAAVIIFSLLMTSLPTSVNKHNSLESKFLSLDTQFNSEYKNIFTTTDNPSDRMLNDALNSATKSKNILKDINATIKDIVDLSNANMNSGNTKEWFTKINQCYVKRQGIYTKYSNTINAQEKLLKIVKSEQTMSASMTNLAENLYQFSSFAKTGDMKNALLMLDKTQTSLAELRTNAMSMKDIVKFQSLDQWISYTDQLSKSLSTVKARLSTAELDAKPTESDYAMIKDLYDVGNLATKAKNSYAQDVRDWVYNNRDSVSKDIDREIIEANQMCNDAYNIYKVLYPNSK